MKKPTINRDSVVRWQRRDFLFKVKRFEDENTHFVHHAETLDVGFR